MLHVQNKFTIAFLMSEISVFTKLNCKSSILIPYSGWKYNISGCHSRILESWISSNHSSDKPHWLQYCHCAKLQQISELTYLILFESFDGMLIRSCHLTLSQVFDTLMLLKWAYYHTLPFHTCIMKLWMEDEISARTVIWSKRKAMLHTRICKRIFGLC